METRSNQSSATDNLLAGLTLFTRFPFWKIKEIPGDAFKRAIEWWPLAGWITGGTMSITFVLASQLWSFHIALVLAIIARVLVTGALHEDGLADVFDGLGGGTTPKRRLEIMKDSHIGTYGVVGLILYYALLYITLLSAQEYIHWSIFLIFDPWCKAISAQIVNLLPYVRPVEDSKIKAVYQRISFGASIRELIIGILPLALWITWNIGHGIVISKLLMSYALPLCIPFCILFILKNLYKKNIGGYTGDCCGATFLILELCTLLTWCALGNIGLG